ncbi:hypothetical protein FHG87_016283 [Trinorchestia longiramus]|nr:hypothetical protein FHG87_016283 [Trinorchestia longiramus]
MSVVARADIGGGYQVDVHEADAAAIRVADVSSAAAASVAHATTAEGDLKETGYSFAYPDENFEGRGKRLTRDSKNYSNEKINIFRRSISSPREYLVDGNPLNDGNSHKRNRFINKTIEQGNDVKDGYLIQLEIGEGIEFPSRKGNKILESKNGKKSNGSFPGISGDYQKSSRKLQESQTRQTFRENKNTETFFENNNIAREIQELSLELHDNSGPKISADSPETGSLECALAVMWASRTLARPGGSSHDFLDQSVDQKSCKPQQHHNHHRHLPPLTLITSDTLPNNTWVHTTSSINHDDRAEITVQDQEDNQESVQEDGDIIDRRHLQFSQAFTGIQNPNRPHPAHHLLTHSPTMHVAGVHVPQGVMNHYLTGFWRSGPSFGVTEELHPALRVLQSPYGSPKNSLGVSKIPLPPDGPSQMSQAILGLPPSPGTLFTSYGQLQQSQSSSQQLPAPFAVPQQLEASSQQVQASFAIPEPPQPPSRSTLTSGSTAQSPLSRALDAMFGLMPNFENAVTAMAFVAFVVFVGSLTATALSTGSASIGREDRVYLQSKLPPETLFILDYIEALVSKNLKHKNKTGSDDGESAVLEEETLQNKYGDAKKDLFPVHGTKRIFHEKLDPANRGSMASSDNSLVRKQGLLDKPVQEFGVDSKHRVSSMQQPVYGSFNVYEELLRPQNDETNMLLNFYDEFKAGKFDPDEENYDFHGYVSNSGSEPKHPSGLENEVDKLALIQQVALTLGDSDKEKETRFQHGFVDLMGNHQSNTGNKYTSGMNYQDAIVQEVSLPPDNGRINVKNRELLVDLTKEKQAPETATQESSSIFDSLSIGTLIAESVFQGLRDIARDAFLSAQESLLGWMLPDLTTPQNSSAIQSPTNPPPPILDQSSTHSSPAGTLSPDHSSTHPPAAGGQSSYSASTKTQDGCFTSVQKRKLCKNGLHTSRLTEQDRDLKMLPLWTFGLGWLLGQMPMRELLEDLYATTIGLQGEEEQCNEMFPDCNVMVVRPEYSGRAELRQREEKLQPGSTVSNVGLKPISKSGTGRQPLHDATTNHMTLGSELDYEVKHTSPVTDNKYTYGGQAGNTKILGAYRREHRDQTHVPYASNFVLDDKVSTSPTAHNDFTSFKRLYASKSNLTPMLLLSRNAASPTSLHSVGSSVLENELALASETEEFSRVSAPSFNENKILLGEFKDHLARMFKTKNYSQEKGWTQLSGDAWLRKRRSFFNLNEIYGRKLL